LFAVFTHHHSETRMDDGVRVFFGEF
jgi:hypothetical protein